MREEVHRNDVRFGSKAESEVDHLGAWNAVLRWRKGHPLQPICSVVSSCNAKDVTMHLLHCIHVPYMSLCSRRCHELMPVLAQKLNLRPVISDLNAKLRWKEGQTLHSTSVAVSPNYAIHVATLQLRFSTCYTCPYAPGG